MNKRIIAFIMSLTVAILSLSGVLAAQITYDTGISVSVDGKKVEFDQQPVIADDRTLVPVRAIFEALGAKVSWDGETRTVTSSKDDTSCTLTIDSAVMNVNGVEKTLDVPAMIINDRTLVPVRAISEAYGCKVEWVPDTKEVIITSSLQPEATSEPTPEPTATPEPTVAPLTDAFADKTICVFGDSLVANSTTWINEVKAALAPKSIVKVYSGTLPLISMDYQDLSSEKYTSRIPEDTDYILVYTGLGEWAWNYTARSAGYGTSLEEGLDNLYFNLSRIFPDAKIIFMTIPYGTLAAEKVDANGLYNRVGLSPFEMSEITVEFANNTNSGIIDLYNETGWGPENYKDYMRNTDGSYIHTNAQGSKIIAQLVIDYLMEDIANE